MKVIYSLLHFANKAPKYLRLSVPDGLPDADREEGLIVSILSEDSSEVFSLNSAEISEVILALSYAREMLQVRKIAAINAKYGKKGGRD